MTGSILWKSVVSAFVLAWAILNIIPVEDTPFKDYIQGKATFKEPELSALVQRAQERSDTGQDPTTFIALKRIVDEENINLQQYFPEIDAHDIKNLKKRNDTLMRYLLSESHGKVKLGLDLKGGVAFTFKVKEEDLSEEDWERTEQLSQAKSIIARRVDGLGVAEPVIRIRGENAIEVQMPGLSTRDNPDAVDSLQAPALLEFSLVHRTADPRTTQTGLTPPGYVLMIEESENPRTGEIVEQSYYIKKVPEMTGEIIESAYAAPNDFGGYRVLLNFTDEGGKTFANVTRRIAEENARTNSLGQLAIILDDRLYSTPSVKEEIKGGAEISGRYTQREAVELANVLNNPLEVGLSIVEMYEVGPSLAKDARLASIEAALLGAALVILFMIIYYQSIGFVAMISVTLNIFIVIGTLASFGATVSLPGIAALILTLGMAVDANILIFERIREELKVGKKLMTALISGYDKALSTIIDANVTTLITAGILIWLGTGPVKGFGVTLAIGIGASMFCALIVSRFMLEFLINAGLIKKVMRLSFYKDREINFLDYRRTAFITSWIIVLIGVITLFANFKNILGNDFTGGDEITLHYKQKLKYEEIQRVADDGSFGEVNPLYQSIIGEGGEVLKIQTESEVGQSFFASLQETYPNAGLNLVGSTYVGASVGKEVQYSALISFAVALIGILLYVALRFEFGYGVGAVVATIHDVLMTIGLYVLLGLAGIGSGQFTAPMVAAILMVIGYSINDSIVVFDRIREELTLNPGMNLKKIVNNAINRTLARTILTSLTTMLASLALYIFAAGVIIDFALVFLIGIITGTFSSIFIASPVFFWWHKGDRRHVEEQHDIVPKRDWESSGKTV